MLTPTSYYLEKIIKKAGKLTVTLVVPTLLSSMAYDFLATLGSLRIKNYEND